MEELKNPQIWLENIGDIILSEDDDILWMLPQIFIFTYESCVASPYFSFDQEDWRLVLMPSDGKQSTLKDNAYFGLFLWMKCCNTTKQKYNVRLSLEDPSGKEKCFHYGELDAYYGFGKWDFLRITDVHGCGLSGRIRIFCMIERIEDESKDLLLGSPTENKEKENEMKNDSKKNDEKQKNVSELKGVGRLVQNFRNLLGSESGCDVTLKTNDHDFRAHRVILSARSPVFTSMFEHDMAEKKTGEVDISDCSTAGFKVFLQYMYSGNTDTMSPSNVLDLYYIADKYQVSDLKSDCVEYMKNNLAVYNFCDVIALSLRHNESDLQRFATRFFCKNVKKVVKTVQWQKYMSENPIQANELFIKAINA